MFSDQLPTIISILFLLAFTIPVTLVALLAKKAQVKNGFQLVLGFYVVYLAVVALAGLSGFYTTVMLPPKIVVTTTLPFAAFLIFIYNTKVCKQANHVLKLEDLVQIHIFRLIGSIFLILLLHELLPPVFALIAGIGDVLTALTSIVVTNAIKKQKSYARRLTYIWNTFGLVDILATAILAIVFTKISIDTGSIGVDILAEFPFCFIPAFAPPTIIFLHLLTYRKLSSLK